MGGGLTRPFSVRVLGQLGIDWETFWEGAVTWEVFVEKIEVPSGEMEWGLRGSRALGEGKATGPSTFCLGQLRQGCLWEITVTEDAKVGSGLDLPLIVWGELSFRAHVTSPWEPGPPVEQADYPPWEARLEPVK